MWENLFIFICALITLLMGLLSFNHDLMWKWHVAAKRREGIKEESLERNKSWETMNIFRGCFFTLLGLVIIAILIVQ